MPFQKLAIILIFVIAASGLTIFLGYNLPPFAEGVRPHFKFILLAVVTATVVWRIIIARKKQ